MQEIWKVDNTLANTAAFKAYTKKHPTETYSCLSTLDDLIRLLAQGHTIGNVLKGSVRSEGANIWRIAPRGIAGGRAEIRLYFYFYQFGKTLYPLLIGDKTSQSQDIKKCKAMTKHLR